MTRRARFAISFAVLAVLFVVSLPAWSAPLDGSASASSDARTKGDEYARVLGYRPLHPELYEQQKAEAAQAAAAQTRLPRPGRRATGTAPTFGPSWAGVSESDVAPPDTYGAIGPSSYVEIINIRMGIYTRTGTKIVAADLATLTGQPHGNLSDPQVIWDPNTNRFYYEVWETAGNTIMWGFSKSANPTSIPGSFCNYRANFGYGATDPDYPKLGQTTDFLLLGVNHFDGGYVGSDILWIQKPQGSATVTTCPAQSSFQLGRKANVQNADGSLARTPVPVIQTDPSTTGWVVADADLQTTPGQAADFLTLFTITKNLDGTANIPQVGQAISVPTYKMPPNAPQKGSRFVLDTSDGRLRHAVAGVDPAQGGAMAIWTSHSVFGGAGSQERWYEIDAATGAVLQQGVATSATLFVFNGGISPDRRFDGVSGQFGSAMVLGFSTSGVDANPAIQMVSKIGANPQSAFVKVKQSPGADQGFDCFAGITGRNECRWGDYSGASADPASSTTGATGAVWLTNEWVTGERKLNSATWRTQNWRAIP
ncbi:MAG TPA: hypothetical protein VKA30_03420 [Actinomycetota bacterium]|nr:hypothetical protein [Actinomycetota bacterium]